MVDVACNVLGMTGTLCWGACVGLDGRHGALGRQIPRTGVEGCRQVSSDAGGDLLWVWIYPGGSGRGEW